MLALLISALIHPAAASTASTFSIPINKACYIACSNDTSREHKGQAACYAPCVESSLVVSTPSDGSSNDNGSVSENKGDSGSNSSDDGGYVSERK